MSERVAIILPVYKKKLAWNEEISYRQTLRVLGKYPIIIVCPDSLDISAYNAIATQFDTTIFRETFEDKYFADIAGYNRLLLSSEFYQRFERYEYILIAQLDTYVFKDDLEQWCAKGFDYVGAPLFAERMVIKEGEVGNGGLSLRRVKAFLTYFKGTMNVIKTDDIAKRIHFNDKPYTRWLVWLLMVFGWRNKPYSFANHYKYNEDCFWSLVLSGSNYELSKPSVEEAFEFAWERFPSEIHKHVGHLPMGCHAWEKYEYEKFWKEIIK